MKILTLDEAKRLMDQNGLGDRRKERYTIREMIEVTRRQYGAERFAEFFEEAA